MTTAPELNGNTVSLRPIRASDLDAISGFEYSVSITEPHSDRTRLDELLAESGFWTDTAGALALVEGLRVEGSRAERSSDRLLGTLQFYRSAPCIHGIEIGYVVHDPADRGKGYAAEALRLFSDHLFANRPAFFRHQLLIEVWNTPSWKVAERCGFVREGVLRSCGFGEGDPADCFVYSRTAKDVRQQQASLNG